MRLLVSGCSLIYGDELSDRNLRWAKLFADHFKFKEIVDLSEPGCSNPGIVRRTTNHLLSDSKFDFVLIGWSYNERQEFYRKGKFVEFLKSSSHKLGWTERTLHSLVFGAYDRPLDVKFVEGIKYRLLLAAFLRTDKIPYLFVPCGDDTLYDTWPNDKYRRAVELDPGIMGGRSYNNSSDDFERGPNGHPLEEANKSWATKIIEYVARHNILPPQANQVEAGH